MGGGGEEEAGGRGGEGEGEGRGRRGEGEGRGGKRRMHKHLNPGRKSSRNTPS